MQTLLDFSLGLLKRKGIEKNLWVKKFIKNILYSKDFIEILFEMPSGCPHSTAGQNPILPIKKRRNSAISDQNSPSPAFKMVAHSKNRRTISLILPNIIHACKKKNL
jgi:hypothetical protein